MMGVKATLKKVSLKVARKAAKAAAKRMASDFCAGGAGAVGRVAATVAVGEVCVVKDFFRG